MEHEIIFNGKYMMKDNCRGVQRYSREVLHALDTLVEPGQIKVLVPEISDSKLDHFENIELIKYGGKITHLFWQNFAFQWYLWMHHALGVCLSDGIPFWNIGICAIHDVRFLQDYKNLNSVNKKIRALYTRFSMWNGAKHAKKIITVSEFSKSEITKAYKINPDRVVVCHNAWQHLKDVKTDESIFDIHPEIERHKYYFLLGGKEDNKNMRWVMEIAKRYTERQFVLAGPPNLYFVDDNSVNLGKLPNCIHVGYVSDEQMRALMKYCRMFLFPSLYEGFGIPPLEAMSVGAKVAMSNAACLPEIYKDYVSYFEPHDYQIDLDQLEAEKHPASEELLNQYSWEKTAHKILDVIREL